MATIQGIYVALFGRPADAAGLAYFNDATQQGADLAAIGDLVVEPEDLNRFSGKTVEEIVRSIYLSLYEREPDPDGLAFFTSLLERGEQTINTIAINILDGARGEDLATLDAKLAAAGMFTAALDSPIEIEGYKGFVAASKGVSFIDGVTAMAPATAESVQDAIGRLYVAAEISVADSTVPIAAATVVTFRFSGYVADFRLDDIEVIGGTLSDLTQISPLNRGFYTAIFRGDMSAGEAGIAIKGAYRGEDGAPGAASSIVFAVVDEGPGVNLAPLAVDDTLTVTVFTGIGFSQFLANDTDPNGDPLLFRLLTEPEHGTITTDRAGSMFYIAESGFVGEDTLTYVANDGVLNSNLATVTITVTGVAPEI